jgi:protein phosphatase
VTGLVRVYRGDLLLLCSDGLSGKLQGQDMLEIVADSNGDLARACQALIDEANERGGEDNITVILARLLGDDLPSPDTDRITVEFPPQDGDDTISHEEDATGRL